MANANQEKLSILRRKQVEKRTGVDGRDKVSQKWSFRIEPPILRKND